MLNLALVLALAAVEPEVEKAVSAIGEKDCPRLFGLLSESFQKAVPAETWPAWCKSVGRLSSLDDLGAGEGWRRFRAKSAAGPVRFEISFDSAGRIAGLRVGPDNAQAAKPDTTVGLEQKLLEIKERHRLRALAVLVQRPGEFVTLSAVGVRKAGEATPVGLTDKWHLGSNTKAMTATLAALLVEEKKLAWSSTISEVLSDWKDLHPAYANITLEMLLSHRSGLTANVPDDVWANASNPKSIASERSGVVRALLRLPPEHASGGFEYSNVGYMVAGVMMERVSGLSWEAALQQKLFSPLSMSDCGFGPPATPGKTDHPWAHRVEKGTALPVVPGPESDNPAGLGPAGTVHCSMADWASFASLHLHGARGEKTSLLSSSSFAKLHSAPAGGNYALGWGVGEPRWAGGKVLTHNGSNTMFYASIWLIPAKNLVFLVATNSGDDSAATAVNETIAFLSQRYASQPSTATETRAR